MGTPTGSNAPADVGVTVLAVRPHPDDESLATGGLLASYSTRGVRTGVVTCTGGEEGEIHHAIARRSRRIACGHACPTTCIAVPLRLPTSFASIPLRPQGNASRICSTG